MTAPRTFAGRLLIVWNLAFANAAALALLALYLFPWLSMNFGAGSVRIAVLIAFALLASNAVFLLRRRRLEPPRHIVSEGGGGSVCIAREALESALRAAGEAVPGVTRMRVAVDPGHPKRISVLGQFHCAEGVSNLDVSGRLRAALRSRLESVVRLPMGTKAEIELEFLGFTGRPPKKGAEAPAERAPEPFLGPRYPIDDEDGAPS
ncbi:MAG: hypothetical protein Fur0037_28820 [Planctomycetota bacterium]